MPGEPITAWRIAQVRYLDGIDEAFGQGAFSGEGARLYGGRWNSRGVPVAYAAASRALALLEVFVHLGPPHVHRRYVLIPATFEEEHVEEVSDPPDGWRTYPAPRATQDWGDRWVEEARSPVLRVPSVVIPAEWNYIFNPRHTDFGKVQIGAPERLDVDGRLTR